MLTIDVVFGTTPMNEEKRFNKLKFRGKIQIILTTTLQKSVRILRRDLET